MLRKLKVHRLMSGFLVFTCRCALLAFVLVVLAANAYTQTSSTAVHKVPEIAVGAGIGAFVLAGGGLLLLADRLRRKNRPKS
jgi:hypothetical protein